MMARAAKPATRRASIHGFCLFSFHTYRREVTQLAQQDRSHRKVERNVDDLVLGLGPEGAQKREVVLHVLKHIHEQEEIEVRIFLLSDIRQLELQPVARQTVRPRKGLGRDVVPPTAASSLQPLMHQPQHLSGATAHIADRRGREVIASDHLKDVLDLPRRFVGMPQWVLDEVFATEVLVSNHRGCSLLSRPPGAVGSVELFICGCCTRTSMVCPRNRTARRRPRQLRYIASRVAPLQRCGAARCEGSVADSGGTDLDAPWSGSLKKISPCVSGDFSMTSSGYARGNRRDPG